MTRDEFAQATGRLANRITGAQAVEWVPLVTQDERAAMEATIRLDYPSQPFAFIEYDAEGRPHRSPTRPFYYPISFVEPLRGNERALGFDLATGPTATFLQRARETGGMVVTSQFRLVQDVGEQKGLVMIWPVFHPLRLEAPAVPGAPPPERFMGFLQSVFRVQDLLETAHSRQPDALLDVLFIDASETEPSKRILLYRPADETAPRVPGPSEAEFRRPAELVEEHAIPIGGRDWRALYRPKAGWIEQQRSSAPLVRLGGVLVLSWLVAGLVILLGRRTQVVRQQVQQRTAELAESQRQLANLLRALPSMAYRCHYDDQLTILFLSEGARKLTAGPRRNSWRGGRIFGT